jgi:hypothetical protein
MVAIHIAPVHGKSQAPLGVGDGSQRRVTTCEQANKGADVFAIFRKIKILN